MCKMEMEGCNSYKVPHIGKAKLVEQEELPSVIIVHRKLVDHVRA